jgi:hypothetical protein
MPHPPYSVDLAFSCSGNSLVCGALHRRHSSLIHCSSSCQGRKCFTSLISYLNSLLPIGSRNPRNYSAYCKTLYSILCSESVLYVVWFGHRCQWQLNPGPSLWIWIEAKPHKTSVHHLSECQLFLQRLTVSSDSARETGGVSVVSVTVYLCSCHHGKVQECWRLSS